MQDETTPYVEQQPRDILTSESWNRMQLLIKEDIRTTSREAAEAIERVAQADNADRLEGRSAAELGDDILKKVLDEVRSRRGYLEVFRILELGKESEIDHGLGAFPLVDVYQLDYFPVVCCEDKEEYPAWVTFYLHHDNERSLRYKGEGETKGTMEIQPRNGPWQGVPFHKFLERYKVPYEPDQSLGDLEGEMWNAFFADPSEPFHDDQICHSPWFDRCCREERSVYDLKKLGDWDSLWVKYLPRKTINYPAARPPEATTTSPEAYWRLSQPEEESADGVRPTPAPTQVQVTQFDWNKLGLRLLQPPVYPEEWFQENPLGLEGFPPLHDYFRVRREELNHLKVMALLKC
jgi:hypothetical protein